MRYCFFFILVILSISCRPTINDLGGSGKIAGILYQQNGYDSEGFVLQSDKPVLLQRITDSSSASFMFSTNTNATGEFSFNYLYTDIIYKLYAEGKRNTKWDNDVLFSASLNSRTGTNIKLILQPDTIKQNGLFIYCVDSVTSQQGLIPSDSIYIYTSSVLAANDSAKISGDGASFRFVTNIAGKALKINLPAQQTLYINAACTYGGKRFTGRFVTKKLRKTGIDSVMVVMKN
jgi:hypothetical protein